MFSRRMFSNNPMYENPNRYHSGSPACAFNTANVQPSSVSVSVAIPTSAPVVVPSIPTPAANPQPTPSAPQPMLHKFNAPKFHSYASDKTDKKVVKDVTAESKLVCAKDQSVIKSEALQGLVKGAVKGFTGGTARGFAEKGSVLNAITKGTASTFQSAVSGYVSGQLKGEAKAGKSCVLALPKDETPKPRP